MTGTLSHFTRNDALFPLSVPQSGRRGDKPDGLWVSVDGPDDWPTWTREEEYCDTTQQYHYRVALADDARILYLGTPEAMDAFTAEYGAPGPDWIIQWAEVAKRYQGIIIAPYQWSRRFELSWYYGWDCASGCIWDASAIDSVELLLEVAS